MTRCPGDLPSDSMKSSNDVLRPLCRRKSDLSAKFMQDPMEVFIDDEAKLTHGLQQHYVKIKENEKNRESFRSARRARIQPSRYLCKSVQRCIALFPRSKGTELPRRRYSRAMNQEERFNDTSFKNFPAMYPRRHQPFLRSWYGYWV